MTGLWHLSSQELKILYDKKKAEGMSNKEAAQAVKRDIEYLNKIYSEHKSNIKESKLHPNPKAFQEAFKQLVAQRSPKIYRFPSPRRL